MKRATVPSDHRPHYCLSTELTASITSPYPLLYFHGIELQRERLREYRTRLQSMLNQKLLMKYGDFKKVNSKGSKKNEAIKAVGPPPRACHAPRRAYQQ